MVERDIGLDAEEVHAGFLADGGAVTYLVSIKIVRCHGWNPMSFIEPPTRLSHAQGVAAIRGVRNRGH